MTKADIINNIADQTGIAKKDVAATVEAFMEEIRVNLSQQKENIYLRGFGSFIVKHRAEKAARNITRQTTMTIPAHCIPAFKPSKSFAAAVKESVKPKSK
jgi:DNA-binding protein HU-beta